MTAQVWSFGPFQITYYPDKDAPDSVQMYSTNALVAAPQAKLRDPLPPIGSRIILQLNIPDLFPFDASHIVQAGDTPSSVAMSLSDFINSGADNPDNAAAFKKVGIVATSTPGSAIVAITQPLVGRPMWLSDESFLSPSPFSQLSTKANPAWDAGPILALGKYPKDSEGKPVPPPVGSNIGQIVIGSWRSDGIPVQYMTIGFNVLDPNTGDCELAVYTQDTSKKIWSLSSRGHS